LSLDSAIPLTAAKSTASVRNPHAPGSTGRTTRPRMTGDPS
jgi:hypothetical protein